MVVWRAALTAEMSALTMVEYLVGQTAALKAGKRAASSAHLLAGTSDPQMADYSAEQTAVWKAAPMVDWTVEQRVGH